ncbi:dispanin subfamily A member 2b-like [Symphorus nematophorus]
MNPRGHPAEFVALQERYHGASAPAGGATVVQYTTVNVTSEPPKDHIIWSLYNFVYSNFFCLGLAALIFSVKSRDRKMAGDLEAARHHGSTARCLNIASTILAVASLIIFIITISIVSIQNQSYYYRY